MEVDCRWHNPIETNISAHHHHLCNIYRHHPSLLTHWSADQARTEDELRGVSQDVWNADSWIRDKQREDHQGQTHQIGLHAGMIFTTIYNYYIDYLTLCNKSTHGLIQESPPPSSSRNRERNAQTHRSKSISSVNTFIPSSNLNISTTICSKNRVSLRPSLINSLSNPKRPGKN